MGLLKGSIALVLLPLAAFAGPTKVDFEDHTIDGEIQRPNGAYLLQRPKTTFRCDITKLTLEEYNVCFEKHLSELCGLQLIERDRFELHRVSSTAVQGSTARAIASTYPFALYLDEGSVYSQEASEFDSWSWDDRRQVLRNQSPRLTSIDYFISTASSFVIGDRANKRIYMVSKRSVDEGQRAYRKVELAHPSHTLLGLVSTERFIVANAREVLMFRINGKAGTRLKVPLDDYFVDPHVDRSGLMLLVGKSSQGKVYLVNAKGDLQGAFPKDPEEVYQLLPNGLVASANMTSGIIKIRSATGVVVSRTNLARGLLQFGVYRQGQVADLFYVAPDGVGILYGDGFEKSFLSRPGSIFRVVEANNGILGIVASSPSRDDPSRWRDRSVEFYVLGRSRSKVAKLVEGVCPNAIRAAERALELSSSLRASMRDGHFNVEPRAGTSRKSRPHAVSATKRTFSRNRTKR